MSCYHRNRRYGHPLAGKFRKRPNLSHQVLELARSGLSDPDIATRLNIHPDYAATLRRQSGYTRRTGRPRSFSPQDPRVQLACKLRADGLDHSAIADRIGVHPRTVKRWFDQLEALRRTLQG